MKIDINLNVGWSEEELKILITQRTKAIDDLFKESIDKIMPILVRELEIALNNSMNKALAKMADVDTGS